MARLGSCRAQAFALGLPGQTALHGRRRAEIAHLELNAKASYAVKVMEISIETEDGATFKETNAYKTMEQEVNVLRAWRPKGFMLLKPLLRHASIANRSYRCLVWRSASLFLSPSCGR